jgi:RNA polymerase sigma factor (sigma-70 family)
MSKDSNNDKKREKAILKGFLSGKQQWIRVFFEEYGGFIKKAVDSVGIKDRSLTKSDLFNDAVEYLLKDNMKVVRLFKGRCKLSTYIYTICLRYAIKIAEPSMPYSAGPDPDTLHAPELLGEEFDEKEKMLCCKIIHLCKPKEQIFIRMMFYEECSTTEIMDFFGWKSENTVYSQKNKIITKLKMYAKRNLLS